MIKAEHITLSYNNKDMIIKDGNFQINKDEFICISGDSGSGKSTLLKSLYGAITPIEGKLVVNDIDLSIKNNNKLLALRKTIGIVFQDYKLISDYTVEENIMLPLQINKQSKEHIKERTQTLLKHISLSHKAKIYPNELSGGEQQKVAVARALAHNPQIIFADEPTGNLDQSSADVIWKLLKSVNEHLGVTVVVVTHKSPQSLGMHFRQLTIKDGVIHEVS